MSQQMHEAASMGKEPENEKEGSPLPPLPKERDAKQPAITSYFMKTPVKQAIEIAEKDKLKPGPNEQKGKEKVKVVTLK